MGYFHLSKTGGDVYSHVLHNLELFDDALDELKISKVKTKRVDFLLEQFGSNEIDRSEYQFSSSTLDLPPLDDVIIKKINNIINSFSRSRFAIMKKIQDQRLREFVETMTVRIQMKLYVNWSTHKRAVKLEPASEKIDGKWIDVCPENNIFKLKTALYNRLSKHANELLPAYMKGKSHDECEAMKPLHFGCVMGFISSFLCSSSGVCDDLASFHSLINPTSDVSIAYYF